MHLLCLLFSPIILITENFVTEIFELKNAERLVAYLFNDVLKIACCLIYNWTDSFVLQLFLELNFTPNFFLRQNSFKAKCKTWRPANFDTVRWWKAIKHWLVATTNASFYAFNRTTTRYKMRLAFQVLHLWFAQAMTRLTLGSIDEKYRGGLICMT